MTASVRPAEPQPSLASLDCRGLSPICQNCGPTNGVRVSWRRRPDSNRSTGLCRPLPNRSATPPEVASLLGACFVSEIVIGAVAGGENDEHDKDRLQQCRDHPHERKNDPE